MKKVFIVLPIIAALTACSSMSPREKAAEKEAVRTFEKSGEKVNLPSWYTAAQNDKDVLTSVASEYSVDMQFAVDKASMSAKRELASNYSSHISAMMKDYSSEVGGIGSDVVREIDRTTKLILAQVNLVGVQRTNLEIRHEKDGYRAYVMMRYSTDESNKILLNEIRKNRQLSHKLQSSKSFQELEEQVDKINPPVQQVAPAPAPAAPVSRSVEVDKPVSFKETISGAVSNKPVVVNN